MHHWMVLIMTLGLTGFGCGQEDGRTASTLSPEGNLREKRRSSDAGIAAAADGGLGGVAAPDTSPPLGPFESLIRMEDARRLPRPVVEELLQSPDVVLRRRTLVALGRVGNAEALGPLRSALTDSDTKTRQIALRSLGQLERSAHEDAEKVLRAFLDLEPRPQDRRAAIQALGRIGSRDSIGPLLSALESPEPRLRAAAARALGNMALRGQGPGEQAMVALASHLTDTDAQVRLSCAFALSRCRELSTGARESLGTALAKSLRRDSDAEVRIMSGRALGALDAGNVGYLIAALENDNDWRVRTAAATAIGLRGNDRQRTRGLKIAWQRVSTDPTRLNGPDVQPLQALLNETAERPAPQLSKALRIIRSGAAKLLASTTTEPARQTLAHIQCNAALAEDRAQGRPGLVRRCAVTDPPLISESERKLLSVRALHGSTIPGALKQLKILLRDPDVAVRLAAVEATGSQFTPLRLSLIEHSLLDENPHVVAAAAHLLTSAKEHYHPEVIAPSQKLVITEHTTNGPVTYTHAEPETKGRQLPAKALIKALSTVDAEKNVETAINLLNAMGALKATQAATVARRWAGHSNQTVRRAARKALEAMELDPGPELLPDPPNIIDPKALSTLARQRPEAVIETTRGPFSLELRPDIAPATVANFLKLAQSGYYTGVRFHRVVPGFVAQTGDPTGTGYGGPGHTIRCELNSAHYERGTVGMALAGPDTGGSQFFITFSAQPHLDWRYTIFGSVTKGMEIVDALQPWDRIKAIRLRDSGP